MTPSSAPEFLSTIIPPIPGSHSCAPGAHACLGHGPPQLRGIEIYQNRPIFYSLGNFIFHREGQDPIPAEQYAVFGLDPQRSSPHEYLAARDRSRHRLSMTGAEYYESVIPLLRFSLPRCPFIPLNCRSTRVWAPGGHHA